MGLIIPIGKHTCARYIVNATEYLTIWDEALVVKDCIAATAVDFLFERIMIRFGCPKVLITIKVCTLSTI